MTGPGLPDEQPVFSHHVRALLARRAQADRDLVGASYRRGRNRQVEVDSRRPRGRGRVEALASVVDVDFHQPSPLRRQARQSGGGRVPHFDMKPIGKSHVPTSKGGKVHHRSKAKGRAEKHFDYLRDGAKVTIVSHLDYIQRDHAVADLAEDLVIDMIDEQVIRAGMNARAIVSNIPGSPERQRSLFVAAERCEREPRVHHLTASTANVAVYDRVAGFASSPAWLRDMSARLKVARREGEAEAAARGRSFEDRQVVVADVTPEEAFERLTWCDRHRSFPAPEWQQGRTGRSHYRFVQELPIDATPQQHGQILRAAVQMLATDGWMAVGVIHQPDPHGDKRNVHIHVDAYDRPAQWLQEHGAWDFEVVVRRNGKDTRPYRQKKVSYRAEPDSSGRRAKVDTAKLMRGRFIDIVNGVMGEERYLHGTYKENGIELTPLEHMGNRAMAHERRGQATEVGSRNAQRIVNDELVACETKAETAKTVLARDMALIVPAVGANADALAAARRYERVSRRLIQRRLDMEVADVVVAGARSRAEAVIATLVPEPGRRLKPRSDDDVLLAAARAHLAWVARHSPSDSERALERKRIARIEAHVRAAWDEVAAAIGGNASRDSTITYVSTRPAPGGSLPHPNYEEQVRGRLRRWLGRHGRDEERLVFAEDTVRLTPGVPMAIDRLMRQFGGEEEFQNWLRDEQVRRAEQAVTDARRGRDKQAAQQRADAARRDRQSAEPRAADVTTATPASQTRAQPRRVDPASADRRDARPLDLRPQDQSAATKVDAGRPGETYRRPGPEPERGEKLRRHEQHTPVRLDEPKGPPPTIRSKGPNDDPPIPWPDPRGHGR